MTEDRSMEGRIGPDTPVWVVWGPTAEWGDGDGPLSYWLTESTAESDKRSFEIRDEEYIADIRRDSNDPEYDGGWPINLGRGYRIVQTTLAEALGVEYAPDDLDSWLDGLLERVEGRIVADKGAIHDAIEQALNEG